MEPKLEYDSDKCHITFEGKLVSQWNDDANCEYPEELTWHRDIGSMCEEIFQAGIEEGLRQKLLKRKER